MELAEEVKSILESELNLDSMKLNACQGDHSEWDSLSYLRILSALEAKYKIEITSENINKFNSIENIVHEIQRQKNNR